MTSIYPKRIFIISILLVLLIGSASAATNMFTDPEAINSSAWTKYYLWRFLNDTVLAPDGNTTADTYNASAGTDNHYLYQGTTFTGGLPYTWSGHFKQYGTNDKIQLTFSLSRFGSVQYATFNVSDCSVTESAVVTTYNETAANGFCRFGITATATSSGTGNGFVIFTGGNTGRAPSYNGTVNPSEAVAAWGMMMEQNARASAYITTPTTGDTIVVTSPNGGESWQRGTSHSVTWNYNGTVGSTVNITLMKAGAEAGTIVDSTSIGSGGAGSYTWSIYGTGTTGSDYTVRVKSNTNTSINDASNAYFTLTSASTPPAGIPANRYIEPGYQFFPSDTIWYQRVDGLEPHPSSTAWINGLKANANIDWGSAPYRYNMSLFVFDAHEIYVVNSSVPKQWLGNNGTTVWDQARDCDWSQIPIPASMTTMVSGSDHTVILVDTSDNLVYEIYSATPNGTGWNGRPTIWNMSSYLYRFSENETGYDNGNRWLGNKYWDRVSNSPREAVVPTWYTNMGSMPTIQGLIRKEEVEAGVINHVIAITVNSANGSAVYPAMGSGHWGSTSWEGWVYNSPPAGAYPRLKASVNLTARGLQPKAQVVATALKQYGGVVTDNGAAYPINVIGANNSVWTAADKADLNTLKYLTLDDFEFVNITPLMIDRYSMQVPGGTGGSAPVSSFYANATDSTYGVSSDNKYNGTTIGGNYNGASDYAYYTAGVDADPAIGSYMGTTVTNKAELLSALSGAVSGDVVYVSPTANIDMGSSLNTIIPAGVTLASNRHGTTDATDGGRIYTTSLGSDWQGRLFQTGGDNVRVTGIKIEGESYPENYSPPSGEGAEYRTGLTIYHKNVTVDNCDFKGFAYSNIVTVNIPTAGRPWIHHNYIHESQNRHEGYGVEVQGGDALVEANVFYKNRHDIAAYGFAGEKYTFRYNIIPDTGTWDVIGMAHVDAHGDSLARGADESYSGEQYDVYHNSFLGGHSAAIHQRGYPGTGMFIYNNNILTDGAQTGVTGNLPIYQTYMASPGYGNVYVSNNQYKGTIYAGGQGLLAYQSKVSPSSWILSTDTGIPLGSTDLTNGAAPFTVTFTDTSTASPSEWEYWARNVTGNNVSFMFSPLQHPSYTFGYGNYSIWLNTSNVYGYNITPGLVFVNVSGSGNSVNFTSNATTGATPLSVKFYDASTTSPVSWSWAYKSNISSTWTLFTQYNQQNPAQVFSTGTTNRLYDINLTVTDGYGYVNNTIKTAYINVSPSGYPVVANFTANITSGMAPLGVLLTDSSTYDPNNWDWYFGNGTKFSDLQSPTVSLEAGTHTINLYSSNYNGGSWKNRTAYITATPTIIAPVANFVADTTYGTVPLTVHFTDLSTNTPTDWQYVITPFGHTGFYATRNPTITFDTVGVYTVVLTATNSAGSDDENKVNYITVLAAPTPTPTPTPTTPVPTTEPTPIPTSSGGPQIQSIANITAKGANLTVTGITGSNAYVMLGQSSHGYTVRTPATTVSSSNALIPVSGVPYGGTTYYASACDSTGCGNEVSFTTLSSELLTETTYSTRYLDPFMANSWDFSKQAPVLVSVFGDTFGNSGIPGDYTGNGNTIVIGAWFVLLIALYWLRQEDVAIPMFMSCILANIGFWTPGLVPEAWKPYLIIVMVLVPIGAIIYSFISSGRES